MGRPEDTPRSQLRCLVDQMAYNLLQEGFERGNTVLLQTPNWPEFVISYFALQKAGLVMVLLTVNHTAREIDPLARLTRPKGWILPDRYRKIDYLPMIGHVRQENPGPEKVNCSRWPEGHVKAPTPWGKKEARPSALSKEAEGD